MPSATGSEKTLKAERITKKLSEMATGDRITWKTRTYVLLGPGEDERRILLYAPSGKIARWPADQLIAIKGDEYVVYHPQVWDDPV